MTFWKILWNKYTKTSITKNIKQSFNKNAHIIIPNFKYNHQNINILLSYDKNININELEDLCDTVGWVRRPVRKVKIAIDNSFIIISLFYKENNHTKLIAFARATSDQTFNATIWDVVVHPNFQKRGFGKILMYETIKKLRYHEINTITLFADPQVINFYKNLGFISDPNGVKGMFWYPKI